MSEIYDEGLLPPNIVPSRTDESAAGAQDDRGADTDTRDERDDAETSAAPPEADTRDQLPGTDDGLHGEPHPVAQADTDPTPAPGTLPQPGPADPPERDPEIAPPTAPERAPEPATDPEVAPLTDPEFWGDDDRDPDLRDPQRPEGTPI